MHTHTARLTIRNLIAVAMLSLSSGEAAAAFSTEELACRSAITTGASKLASAAYKAVATCHKRRDRSADAAATDCNDIGQADAVKMAVARAVDKLASTVGGDADRCSGSFPEDLGYYNCPSPCDTEVPAIETFSDVAECVSCLVQERTTAITTDALGSPAPPLEAIDAKCHSALAKSQGKQLARVLKTRNKCQYIAEKTAGVEDLASCTGGADADGDAAIGLARSKAESVVAVACQPADLDNLDSCDGASLSGLQACVLDGADSAGEDLFAAFHGLGTAGPTTTVPPTTTTMPPPATWTVVQGILETNCGGCHTNSSVSGGLGGLDDYDAGYANLVNADSSCGSTSYDKRVLPGDSASSLLMRKLDWTHDCGAAMPFGGAKLSAGTRSTIRSWIDAGALKN